MNTNELPKALYPCICGALHETPNCTAALQVQAWWEPASPENVQPNAVITNPSPAPPNSYIEGEAAGEG